MAFGTDAVLGVEADVIVVGVLVAKDGFEQRCSESSRVLEKCFLLKTLNFRLKERASCLLMFIYLTLHGYGLVRLKHIETYLVPCYSVLSER